MLVQAPESHRVRGQASKPHRVRGCRKRMNVSYGWPSKRPRPPNSHPFTFLSVTALVAAEPRQESFIFSVRAAVIMPRSIM